MRDIKFRAWHKSNSEMVVIDMQNITTDPYRMAHLCDLISGDHPDGVIMQFTGLQDKNGVDIYDGDILRIPHTRDFEKVNYNCFEVFYHDNECIGGQNIGFCMNRMHSHGSSGGGRGYKFTPESIFNHGFVVIGNIHENPELLK